MSTPLVFFKKALDNLPVGITITDRDRRIIYTNPTDAAMHRYSVKELIGKDVRVFAPPELYSPAPIEELTLEKYWRRESINKRKDEQTFPVQLCTNIVTDKNGKPSMIVTVCEDISDRKSIEESSWENELKFRKLIEVAFDGIAVTEKGKFIDANDQFLNLFGYNRLELIGMLVTNLIASEARHDAMKKILSGYDKPYESLCMQKDGSIFPVEVCGKTYIMQNREIRVTALRDISERKKAQKDLEQVRQEWEQIFQAIGHPTIILDPDHNILAANHAAIKAIGKTKEETIGKKCYEIFHTSTKPPPGCPLDQMLTSNHLEATDMEIEAFGGIFLVSCTPVFDAQGHLQKIIHIATDITKRKKAEDALRDSESHIKEALSVLNATLESTADGILVIDRQGRMAKFNQKFVQMWNIPKSIIKSRNDEEALAFVLEQLKDPESFLSKVRELYLQPEAVSYDVIEFKDGKYFERYSQPQKIEDKILGRVWSFRDVTDRKKAEDKLKKNEKELKKRVKELEEFYDMAVGRELKMVALKKEIEQLKKQIEEFGIKPNKRECLSSECNKCNRDTKDQC
jgi:PAS domain S-box-containing protein